MIIKTLHGKYLEGWNKAKNRLSSLVSTERTKCIDTPEKHTEAALPKPQAVVPPTRETTSLQTRMKTTPATMPLQATLQLHQENPGARDPTPTAITAAFNIFQGQITCQGAE